MKIIFDFNRTLFDPEKGELFDGVGDLLASLSKKNELYLITTETGTRADLIKNLGIGKFFKKVLFTPQKSENDFKDILQGDTQAIVVGDMQEQEIRIGSNLNLTTILISKEQNTRATHTIQDIKQLNSIIKNE